MIPSENTTYSEVRPPSAPLSADRNALSGRLNLRIHRSVPSIFAGSPEL